LGEIELFAETTNNFFDGQHNHTNCDTIPVEAPVEDFQGVDKEPHYYETTHQNNNSEATPDSHTPSVIQGDTDGGIPTFVEELEIYSGGEPISNTIQVCKDGNVSPTPPAGALLKRPAPAPKDSEASESSPKRPKETRDVPDIESETPLQRPPPEAAPATNTGSSLNTTTNTADSTSSSVTDPITNITIQINTDTGSSLNRRPGADPKGPKRCKDYREREKVKKEKQKEDLKNCLEKQRKLKAEEADLKNPGSSAARDAVSNSEPIEIEILDRPLGSLGSNNDDNVIYIVTKSELMDASQNIKKAAEWRSLSEDFNVEPRQPSDEQKVKDQKSLRNCREKKKAVDALKLCMIKTLKAENIALEANIKQLQQDQDLLAQQHQQQLHQNSGSPTQAQQPESQAQPQQQAQVVKSGALGGVKTIRVNQQQPQVVQLQPQQQQQQQPQTQVFQLQPQQQQQQQAQPHHQMQQPGAVAGPPGGIQILHPFITSTGEIYQIPIQLNAEQLQVLRAQMMGGAGSSQNIVIHTAPIQTQLAQPAQTVQTIQLQGGQQMYYIQ